MSTVGHYIPRGAEKMDTIGAAPDAFFETFVFPADGVEPGGDANVKSWESVDSIRYAKSIEAERGHYAMCEKWHARVS